MIKDGWNLKVAVVGNFVVSLYGAETFNASFKVDPGRILDTKFGTTHRLKPSKVLLMQTSPNCLMGLEGLLRDRGETHHIGFAYFHPIEAANEPIYAANVVSLEAYRKQSKPQGSTVRYLSIGGKSNLRYQSARSNSNDSLPTVLTQYPSSKGPSKKPVKNQYNALPDAKKTTKIYSFPYQKCSGNLANSRPYFRKPHSLYRASPMDAANDEHAATSSFSSPVVNAATLGRKLPADERRDLALAGSRGGRSIYSLQREHDGELMKLEAQATAQQLRNGASIQAIKEAYMQVLPIKPASNDLRYDSPTNRTGMSLEIGKDIMQQRASYQAPK